MFYLNSYYIIQAVCYLLWFLLITSFSVCFHFYFVILCIFYIRVLYMK
jgi:hypothetical protein